MMKLTHQTKKEINPKLKERDLLKSANLNKSNKMTKKS